MQASGRVVSFPLLVDGRVRAQVQIKCTPSSYDMLLPYSNKYTHPALAYLSIPCVDSAAGSAIHDVRIRVRKFEAQSVKKAVRKKKLKTGGRAPPLLTP